MISTARLKEIVSDLGTLTRDHRVAVLVDELLATRRELEAARPVDPIAPDRVPRTDRAVRAWMQRALPRHLHLLDRAADKLTGALEPHQELDGDGQLVTIPADVTRAGTPDRGWVRAWRTYLSGFAGVVGAEQDRARLQLLARRAGMDVLTDEEYERELIELGREAVRAISDDEWRAEGVRRGLLLAAGSSSESNPQNK